MAKLINRPTLELHEVAFGKWTYSLENGTWTVGYWRNATFPSKAVANRKGKYFLNLFLDHADRIERGETPRTKIIKPYLDNNIVYSKTKVDGKVLNHI